MKFIADVNVAQVVIKLASKESRIILTHDRDFLGFSKFPKYQAGIIVIRLSNQKTLNHLKKLKQLLEKDTEEVLMSSLTILTEDSIEHYPYKARSSGYVKE